MPDIRVASFLLLVAGLLVAGLLVAGLLVAGLLVADDRRRPTGTLPASAAA